MTESVLSATRLSRRDPWLCEPASRPGCPWRSTPNNSADAARTRFRVPVRRHVTAIEAFAYQPVLKIRGYYWLGPLALQTVRSVTTRRKSRFDRPILNPPLASGSSSARGSNNEKSQDLL